MHLDVFGIASRAARVLLRAAGVVAAAVLFVGAVASSQAEAQARITLTADKDAYNENVDDKIVVTATADSAPGAYIAVRARVRDLGAETTVSSSYIDTRNGFCGMSATETSCTMEFTIIRDMVDDPDGTLELVLRGPDDRSGRPMGDGDSASYADADGNELARNAMVVVDTFTISDTPPPPAAPTGVTATAGNLRIDVEWDAVTGATSYEVCVFGANTAGGARSSDLDGNCGIADTVTGITATSVTLTSTNIAGGINNGTFYSVGVYARNAAGLGPVGLATTADTQFGTVQPMAGATLATATMFTVTQDASSTSVTVSWDWAQGDGSVPDTFQTIIFNSGRTHCTRTNLNIGHLTVSGTTHSVTFDGATMMAPAHRTRSMCQAISGANLDALPLLNSFEVDSTYVFRMRVLAFTPAPGISSQWATPDVPELTIVTPTTVTPTAPNIVLSTDKAAYEEGENIVVTATATPAPTADLTVNVRLEGGGIGGFFVLSNDANHNREITITGGETTGTVDFPTRNDTHEESDTNAADHATNAPRAVVRDPDTAGAYTFDNTNPPTFAVTDNDLQGGSPSITSATAGDGEITVVWSAPTELGSTGAVQNFLVCADPVIGDARNNRNCDGGLSTFELADHDEDGDTTDSSYTYTITGLTNGTAYYIGVGMRNGITNTRGGNIRGYSAITLYQESGSDATVTPVMGLPDPPTNVVATAGDMSIEVTWTNAADETGLVEYVVCNTVAATAAAAETACNNKVADGSGNAGISGETSPATVANRTNGTAYYIFVQGNYGTTIGRSVWAAATPNPVTPTAGAPPNPPQNLAATPGNAMITLTWDAPAGGATPTGYEVCGLLASVTDFDTGCVGDDHIEVISSAATRTLLVDDDTFGNLPIANGTAYHFAVRTVAGTAMSAWSTPPVEATPTGPTPDAPTGPQSVGVAANPPTVRISWVAPTGGAVTPSGYEICVVSGSTLVANLEADCEADHIVSAAVGDRTRDVTNDEVAGVTIFHDFGYLLAVRATHANGNSDWATDGETATPTAAPTLSSDATLSVLTLTGVSPVVLSPVFARTTYSYTASVANSESQIVVTATPNDANAGTPTIAVDTDDDAALTRVDLAEGANVITITVTAENTDTQNYIITVTREAAAPQIAPPVNPMASAGDGSISVELTAPTASPGFLEPTQYQICVGQTSSHTATQLRSRCDTNTGGVSRYSIGGTSQTHSTGISNGNEYSVIARSYLFLNGEHTYSTWVTTTPATVTPTMMVTPPPGLVAVGTTVVPGELSLTLTVRAGTGTTPEGFEVCLLTSSTNIASNCDTASANGFTFTVASVGGAAGMVTATTDNLGNALTVRQYTVGARATHSTAGNGSWRNAGIGTPLAATLTPPGAPTSAGITAGELSLIVAFAPAVGGTTPEGFEVCVATGTALLSDQSACETGTTTTVGAAARQATVTADVTGAALVGGTAYAVVIRATHSTAGDSTWTAAGQGTPDVAMVGEPTGVTASDPSDTGFDVSWTAPSGPPSPTSYDICVVLASQLGLSTLEAECVAGNIRSGVSITTATVDNSDFTGVTIAASTDYIVSVRAQDSVSSSTSAWADGASITTLAALSTDATLSALTVTGHTLAPPFASGTTRYDVTTTLATVSVSATPNHASASVTGARLGLNYDDGAAVDVTDLSAVPLEVAQAAISGNRLNIRVTAEDGLTTTDYQIRFTRLPTVPGEPTSVSASRTGIGVVTATWAAPSGLPAAEGFEVCIGEASSYADAAALGSACAAGTVTPETAGASDTSLAFSGVAPGEYRVAVRATAAGGEGEWAGPTGTVTVPARPGPPTVTVSAVDASLALTITAPTVRGPNTEYETCVGVVDDYGDDVDNFLAACEDSTSTGLTYRDTSASLSVTVGSADGVSNAVTYFVAVRATDPDAGVGSWRFVPGDKATPTSSVRVSQPTDVTASARVASIVVGWTAPTAAPTPDAFEICVLPPALGGTYSVECADTEYVHRIASGSAIMHTAVSANFTGFNFANGTEYRAAVRATHTASASESSWVPSVPVRVTPLSAPGVPTSVTADGGDGSITVTWEAPAALASAAVPTSYEVCIRTSTQTESPHCTDGTANVDVGDVLILNARNTHGSNAITNAVTYTVSVRAVHTTFGAGAYSGTVTATPERPPLPNMTISATQTTFTEGTDGNISFTVTSSSNAPGVSVTVTLTGGDDYVDGAGRTQDASFTGSAREVQVNFPIDDDGDVDADATVTATMSTNSGAYTLNDGASTTAMVTDSDVPTVSITTGKTTYSEADGTITATVTAAPTPIAPLDVMVRLASGGAFVPGLATQTVTVPTSGGTATVTWTLDDDDMNEPNTDGAFIGVEDGTGYMVSSTNGAVLITITNNDFPPGVPDNISVTQGTEPGTLDVSWTNPTVDSEGNPFPTGQGVIIGYDICAHPLRDPALMGGFCVPNNEAVTVTLDSSAPGFTQPTSATLTGLQEGSAVFIAVRVRNEITGDNAGAWDAPAGSFLPTPTPAPGVPRNIVLSQTPGTITVTWAGPEGGTMPEGYEVCGGNDATYASTAALRTACEGSATGVFVTTVTAGDALTASFGSSDGIMNGQTYRVLVRATHSLGGNGPYEVSDPETTSPRALGTDATLSALSISQGTLDQTFAPGTTTYTATVANDVSSVGVSITASDPLITGQTLTAVSDGSASFGQVNLIVGDNVIEIVITAEDGIAMETYTITVTREDPPAASQPVGVTAAPGDGTFTINWSPPTDPPTPTAYEVCVVPHMGFVSYDTQCAPTDSSVQVNASDPTTLTVDNDTYAMVTITNEVAYRVGVRSLHGDGNSDWATLPFDAVLTQPGTVTPTAGPPPPGPPTGVMATVDHETRMVTVNWVEPTGDTAPEDYTVCLASLVGGGGVGAVCAAVRATNTFTAAAGVTTHIITVGGTGLGFHTEYTPAVRSNHATHGDSDWSQGEPVTPRDSRHLIDTLAIYPGADTSGTALVLSTDLDAINDDGLDVALSAQLNTRETQVTLEWTLFDTDSTTSDGTIAITSTHTYTLASGASADITFTVENSAITNSAQRDKELTITVNQPLAAMPGRPTAVTATQVAQTRGVTVAWELADDGGSAVTNWRVSVSSEGNTTVVIVPANLVGSANAPMFSYTVPADVSSGGVTTEATGTEITALVVGTSYGFNVAAQNAIGTGETATLPATLSPALALTALTLSPTTVVQGASVTATLELPVAPGVARTVQLAVPPGVFDTDTPSVEFAAGDTTATTTLTTATGLTMDTMAVVTIGTLPVGLTDAATMLSASLEISRDDPALALTALAVFAGDSTDGGDEVPILPALDTFAQVDTAVYAIGATVPFGTTQATIQFTSAATVMVDGTTNSSGEALVDLAGDMTDVTLVATGGGGTLTFNLTISVAAERPTLTIEAVASSFTEDDEFVDFTIRSDVAVPAGGVEATVTLSGADDYVADGDRTVTVTLAEGVFDRSFSFAMEFDDIQDAEATATATINMGSGTGTGEYNVGDPSTATVTITDNDDNPMLESAAWYLGGDLTGDLLELSPAFDPAGTAFTVQVPANAGQVTLDFVTINADTTVTDGGGGAVTTGLPLPLTLAGDNDELALTFTSPTGAMHTVTFTLQRGPTITISAAAGEVTEAENAQITFNLNSDRPAPTGGLTVAVTLSDNTFVDAGARTAMATFTAGGSTATASFTINNDEIAEPDAEVTATIGSSTEYQGDGETATVMVLDDDELPGQPTEVAGVQVAGTRTVTLTWKLAAAGSGDITQWNVAVSGTDSGAANFNITAAQATLDAGTGIYTYAVPGSVGGLADFGHAGAEDGTLDEGQISIGTAYTFSVRPETTVGQGTASDASAPLTLTLTPSALMVSDATIAEDAGTITITVTLPATPGVDVTVPVSLSPSPMPLFGVGNPDVAIANGATEGSVTLTAIDTPSRVDAAVTVTLAPAGDARYHAGVVGNDALTAAFTITNDDMASTAVDEATLFSLALTDATLDTPIALDPEFDTSSATRDYTVAVDDLVESVLVSAEATSTAATVAFAVDGTTATLGDEVALAFGNTVATVTVTSGDSSEEETYAVTITRTASAASDAFSFTARDGVEPNALIESEAVTVSGLGADVRSSVRVTGDAGAALTINGEAASAPTRVSDGDMLVASVQSGVCGGSATTITVTIGGDGSTGGEAAEFTVTPRDCGTTAALRNLVVRDDLTGIEFVTLTPDFDGASRGPYRATVATDVARTNVFMEADTGGTVTATLADGTNFPVSDPPPDTGFDLEVGENAITITVTAEASAAAGPPGEGTLDTMTYELVITRANPPANANLNFATLSLFAVAPGEQPSDLGTPIIFTPSLAVINEDAGNYELTAEFVDEPGVDTMTLGLDWDFTADATTAGTVVQVDGAQVNAPHGFMAEAGQPDNFSITLELYVSDDERRTITLSVMRTTALGDDARLRSLTIAGAAATLGDQSADAVAVEARVPSDATELTVEFETTHPQATLVFGSADAVVGAGSFTVPLPPGATSSFSFTVTSQDESSVKTYTVSTTRRATDATVTRLALYTGATVDVNNLVEDFTATLDQSGTGNIDLGARRVDPSVTQVTFEVETADPRASAVTTTFALSAVSNDLMLVVSAEDGNTRTFTITIEARLPNTDATLSALDLSGVTLDTAFAPADPPTTMYTATVANTVASTEVTATLSDRFASAVVTAATPATADGNVVRLLNTGMANPNVITITVTAEDGTTTRDYVVSIVRLPSSDATLSALTLSALTLSGTTRRGGPVTLAPRFAPGTGAYTAEVANRIILTEVTATPGHPGATVVVTAADPATVDGIMVTLPARAADDDDESPDVFTITITVTAQDGVATMTYTVTVERSASTTLTMDEMMMERAASGVVVSATDRSTVQQSVGPGGAALRRRWRELRCAARQHADADAAVGHAHAGVAQPGHADAGRRQLLCGRVQGLLGAQRICERRRRLGRGAPFAHRRRAGLAPRPLRRQQLAAPARRRHEPPKPRRALPGSIRLRREPGLLDGGHALGHFRLAQKRRHAHRLRRPRQHPASRRGPALRRRRAAARLLRRLELEQHRVLANLAPRQPQRRPDARRNRAQQRHAVPLRRVARGAAQQLLAARRLRQRRLRSPPRRIRQRQDRRHAVAGGRRRRSRARADPRLRVAGARRRLLVAQRSGRPRGHSGLQERELAAARRNGSRAGDRRRGPSVASLPARRPARARRRRRRSGRRARPRPRHERRIRRRPELRRRRTPADRGHHRPDRAHHLRRHALRRRPRPTRLHRANHARHAAGPAIKLAHGRLRRSGPRPRARHKPDHATDLRLRLGREPRGARGCADGV